jgi:ankyrin repeat protein
MRFQNSIAAVVALFAPVLYLTVLSGANSPIADAAMRGDKAAVQALIAQKTNVNLPQADGATAIQWAAYRNDLAMADMLIAAKADVRIPNRDGATALRLASINGSTEMIQKLLKAGADANEASPNGETPIMFAARTGKADAVEALINAGANVNARENIRGTTALMWAAEQAHPEAVRVLIAAGADVSAKSNADTKGNRAYLANPVKQRLKSAFGADSDSAKAAKGQGKGGGFGGFGGGQGKGGNAKGKGKGGDANANPEDGDVVALADAAAADAAFGRTRDKDGGGLTPLVYAARQNCIECAKLMIAAGANVNQTTNYGWTPLLTATQNRNYKFAALLLDNGADPNKQNNGGWSPLYLATDNRNIETGDYPTPKADMDQLEYIKLLLSKGANPNIRICGVRSNPAAKETFDQCVGDSTETRTNFTMQWLFEDGATPFIRAAQSSDVDLMNVLLKAGADPKIRTAHDVTALAVASGIAWVQGVTFEWSKEKNLQTVKMLLDLGIDPNQQDDEGRAALHGAAHKGYLEVIQMLVDHGAKLDMNDHGSRDTVNGDLLGKTWIPLHYAQGLVRVGVQSAVAHPDAEKLLAKLMTDRGIPIPPPIKRSFCVTPDPEKGCQ